MASLSATATRKKEIIKRRTVQFWRRFADEAVNEASAFLDVPLTDPQKVQKVQGRQRDAPVRVPGNAALLGARKVRLFILFQVANAK